MQALPSTEDRDRPRPRLPSIGEITYVSVGGVDFKLNPNGSFGPTEEGQPPFKLGNGATITLEGNLPSNGKTKRFHADVPLLF